MAADFPDNPSVNDIFTVGDRSWIWNGTTWDAAVEEGPAGPEGPTGPEGPAGGWDSTQTIQNVTANQTLTADFAGKLVTNTGASTEISVTLPGAGSGVSVGQQVDFVQTHATNKFYFVGASGVSVLAKGSSERTAEQYAPATITRLSDTSYLLLGDLGA